MNTVSKDEIARLAEERGEAWGIKAKELEEVTPPAGRTRGLPAF